MAGRYFNNSIDIDGLTCGTMGTKGVKEKFDRKANYGA